MKAVYDMLSPLEKERFETSFRLSVIDEPKIKKILTRNLGITGNPKTNKVIASAAKAYVALLTEEAKMIQLEIIGKTSDEVVDLGPIEPY